jgi:hypothetical protein
VGLSKIILWVYLCKSKFQSFDFFLFDLRLFLMGFEKNIVCFCFRFRLLLVFVLILFCNHDWFWNTKVLYCLVENIFMDLLFLGFEARLLF